MPCCRAPEEFSTPLTPADIKAAAAAPVPAAKISAFTSAETAAAYGLSF